MNRLMTIFHRRSITFALVALLFSLLAAGTAPSLATHPSGVAFTLCAIILFVVALVVCIHATVNLARDVERGYSPNRCSLAVVILFFAFGFLLWAGFSLVLMILRARDTL
jgi:hypothetical protein